MRDTFKRILLVCFVVFSVAAPSFADTIIPPSWAGAPPSVDGIVSPGEWNAGTETTLTQGKMRTLNDSSFLYVLLDVTTDTTADNPPLFGGDTGDYFVFHVDVDRNNAVTPNVDILYSTCQDGQLFVKATKLSQFSSTGCQSVDSFSLGTQGFGGTFNSAVAHRYWEFRLNFSEIGVDPSTWGPSGGTTARVRLSVGLSSETPAFTTYEPDPSSSPNMANLFRIDLALGAATPVYPPGTDGPVFAGVGFVPSTFIVSGYANINIAGYYSATDAPFGGRLNVFGHWNSLAALPGAKKYRVTYSKDGGPFQRLLQTFTNFKFVAGTWVPQSIAPDVHDAYRIPDPAEIWYLSNLLISWESGGFPNGMYELRLEILNNGGGVLASPAGNSLTLYIDNTAPVVKINQIYYNGGPVCACAIVTQGDAPRGFTFNISVTDANGALNGWSLAAAFGNNEGTGSIASDNYALNMDSDGFNRWNGDAFITVPVTPFRVSKSCAYTWVLAASSRIQNGYGLIYPSVTYHQSLTTLLGTGDGGSTSCSP